MDEKRMGFHAFRRFRKTWLTFLTYLDQQGYPLERLTPDHVDAYLKHLGQTWSRASLSSAAHALRTWFRYCEVMGRTPAGLADSMLAPRIYRHEGLPFGPTWEQVKGIIPGSPGGQAISAT
jgi:integrase/recombinase XerD